MGMLGAPGCLRKDLAYVSGCGRDSCYISIPQDASRDIATTTNCDHKIRFELIENLWCGFLAHLVDLSQAVTLATALVPQAHHAGHSCK